MDTPDTTPIATAMSNIACHSFSRLSLHNILPSLWDILFLLLLPADLVVE
jgi:hypothetical protein